MSRPRNRAVFCGLVLALLTGCGAPRPPALPQVDTVPAIDPAEVESVLFFLGDPGEAYLSTSPVLARLRQEIEEWSGLIQEDSSVALIVLGDIRYPEGVREIDAAPYEADTAVVMSQVRTVTGPNARLKGTVGYFLPGNHDWGLDEHWEGYLRLHNLYELLEHARTDLRANVYLEPEVGTGGPFVLDWGEHFRILMLDTPWWILAANDETRAQQLALIEQAISTAGDREILIAGHHPFKSAGSHGGQFSFWRTLGLRYVLNRSGAILEDLTSIPYRYFERGLRDIFSRHGPPLVFAGGHDHSLQVIQGTLPTDPEINLVSGSASKLSEVGQGEGVIYGQMAPGYMKMIIERDGDVTIFVEAAPAQYQTCPTIEEQRVPCMAEGVAAFETRYWRRIRGEGTGVSSQ